MRFARNTNGYILPTVLVFSLVTVALGITFLQYATSFSSILRNDHYANLAKQAAESGVLIAQKCFQQENLTVEAWPDDATLQPNIGCDFAQIADASQFVSETSAGNSGAVLRTTYTVGKPTIDDRLLTFTATGTTELRASETSAHAAFTETAQSKIQVPMVDGHVEIDAARGVAVTDITTGSRHTCAIANMEPYCWGANLLLQAGATGGTSDRITPVKLNTPSSLPSGSNFINRLTDTISAGPDHTCASAENGRFYCWGANVPFGTLGVGNHVSPINAHPTHISQGLPGSTNVTSISNATPSSQFFDLDAQRYGCTIATGRVACVGQNFFAQLGQIDYCTSWQLLPPGWRYCSNPLPTVPTPQIKGTARFTMWAHQAGWNNYFSETDSNTYLTVFGYDKSVPGHNGSSTNHVNLSQIGKYNASELAAGQTMACASENGRVFCWGNTSMPWVWTQNQNLGLEGLFQVRKGNVVDNEGWRGGSLNNKMAHGLASTHTSHCAIADGQAHCWSGDLWNRTLLNAASFVADLIPLPESPPSAISKSYTNERNVTFISRGGGSSYSCFVASGEIYCWGRMTGMQSRNRPVNVEAPGFVTTMDSGGESSCMVANGSAYCFGTNGSGQLGDGTKTTRSTPTKTSTIGLEDNTHAMTSLDAGDSHTCGIVNGDVFCWGDNTHGQLGTADTAAKPRPTRIDLSTIPATSHRSATDISAGKNHTCAVIEGDAWCWGSNEYNQLGRAGAGSNVPERVNLGTNAAVTAISAGHDHTCAVVNGQARCWGRNDNGQLGRGNTNVHTTPAVAPVQRGSTNQHVTQIAAGENFTCALAAERVWCWGANDRGQIGRGSTGGANQTTAREVVIGSSAHNGLGHASTKLTVGDKFACTLVNKVTQCWGDNTYGQLGRGNQTTNNATAAPAAVSGPIANAPSFDISAGSHHMCSITNGQTYCWGRNQHGQIGNDSAAATFTTPTLTQRADGVLLQNHPYRLAGGGRHTCAIANGKVACWGHGENGQRGLLAPTSSRVPGWAHDKYAISGLELDWDRAVRF